eukprot:344642_1
MQQMKHSIRHAQMAPTCLPAPFLLPLVPRLLVVRDEKSMSTSSSALASTKQFDSQSFVKQFYLTRECLSKHDIAQEDNPIIQMMILRHMAVMATKSEEQVILSAKAIAIAEIPQNQWIDFVEPSDFVSAQGYRIFAYCRRKVYNFWCREIIGDISKQSVIGTNVCARIEKAIQWNSDVTDTRTILWWKMRFLGVIHIVEQEKDCGRCTVPETLPFMTITSARIQSFERVALHSNNSKL